MQIPKTEEERFAAIPHLQDEYGRQTLLANVRADAGCVQPQRLDRARIEVREESLPQGFAGGEIPS
jgi:hypothetical protein